jgi:hypothetical protein
MALKKTLKSKLQKATRFFKKINLAIPRQAFLGLIKLNIFNMAYHLNESLKNPVKRQKLLTKWTKLGGNQKTLILNIGIGVKKYKRKHPAYIGVEPTTTAAAAAIAAATPIIIALLEFVGKGAKDRAQKNAESATPEIKEQITASQQVANAPATNFTSSPSSSRSAETTETGSGSATNNEEETASTNGTSTGMPKNILLYAGLGLGAYFLLTRKK